MSRTKAAHIVLTALILTGFTTALQAASPNPSVSPAVSFQTLREELCQSTRKRQTDGPLVVVRRGSREGGDSPRASTDESQRNWRS